MKLLFKSNKLEKSLTIPKEIQKTYGVMAKKINQRMKEFSASADLSVLKSLPGTNFHELSGQRKGQYAVSVSGNWRILFEPASELPDADSIPCETDLKTITSIRLIEVVDYH